MKRIVIALVIGIYLAGGMFGCGWMGRTSGKAVQGTKNVYNDAEQGVKDGADNFDKGYDQGKKSMKE